jgi:predicted RNase H-like HicB family nuclease
VLQYHAAYYAIEDGWYMVRVLDFPGTISQGRSIDHARRMIRDALRMMAEYKLEKGEVLPRPNPRARDKKAALVEPIKLRIRVLAGSGQ